MITMTVNHQINQFTSPTTSPLHNPAVRQRNRIKHLPVRCTHEAECWVRCLARVRLRGEVGARPEEGGAAAVVVVH